MIVIAGKVGRLANRLLLFAHFIGAAVEHGLVVVNPSLDEYARYFPATARDALCRFPPGRALPPVRGSRRLLFDASSKAADLLHRGRVAVDGVGLIRLDRREQVDLDSAAFLEFVRGHRIVLVQDWFFRSAADCERHRDVIRAYLTPRRAVLERACAAAAAARSSGALVVGVHVRRGDYWRFLGGAFYYSHAQYRAILARVAAAFPDRDVAFLVCSDEPVPAGAFEGLDVHRGSGHELEDLFALASCDLIIGPPSTFSGWASFYGDVPLCVIDDPDLIPAPSSFEPDRGLVRCSARQYVAGAEPSRTPSILAARPGTSG